MIFRIVKKRKEIVNYYFRVFILSGPGLSGPEG